jgi:AraC-like DNA-binding protein
VRGSEHRDFEISRFSQESLALLKRELSALARMEAVGNGTTRLASAAAALRVLEMCLRTLGWFGRAPRPMSPHVRIFERLLAQPDAFDVRVGVLAKRAGFNRDYLSRKFREATGLTLRERRDAARLKRARRLLRSGRAVGEVAAEVGIPDPNYFARWFKKHTGLQPSRMAG